MMKKIGKIVLLVLILVGGFCVGFASKYYIDQWRARRNVTLWMDSLDPFKNDKYGGATPEETFDLYLAALKKGDLELASRYFWVDKQKKRLELLNAMNNKDELKDYISRIQATRNTWTKKQDINYDWVNKAAYEYEGVLDKDVIDTSLGVEIRFKAGEYKSLVEFIKSNNIWKLYN